MRKSVIVEIPNQKQELSSEEKVYNLIKKKPITITDIGRKLGMSDRTVAYHTKHLKMLNKIDRIFCKCCGVGILFKAL